MSDTAILVGEGDGLFSLSLCQQQGAGACSLHDDVAS